MRPFPGEVWGAIGTGMVGRMETMSRCPVCGARVYVNAGTPTPTHQAEGETATCPGSGRPSK